MIDRIHGLSDNVAWIVPGCLSNLYNGLSQVHVAIDGEFASLDLLKLLCTWVGTVKSEIMMA